MHKKTSYKILFFLGLLCLWHPVTPVQASGIPWQAIYRINFSVENRQPKTLLIIETLTQDLVRTGRTIEIALPCDVIGNVRFSEDHAIFDGGYLECTHNDLAPIFEGILAKPIPRVLDADGIYFDGYTIVDIDSSSSLYPIMSYDDATFAIEPQSDHDGVMKLHIGNTTTNSRQFSLLETQRTSVYQTCEQNCQFSFYAIDEFDEVIDRTDTPANATYPIDTDAKTFYIGYDPVTRTPFRGTMESVDFDPTFCRCHG